MKKILLSLGIIGLVGVGAIGATRAFFSSTATATGNVFTAGSLNLAIAKDSNGTPVNGWLGSQSASWNFSNMAPGGTPSVSSVWLKNTGSVDATKIGISSVNTGTAGFGKQIRITKLTLGGSNLLQGGAGATIGAYVAPTSCDVTVSGTKLSDATTNSANSGKVVCVAPGNYSSTWEGMSTIPVTYPMTIASTQGTASTSTIPFDVTASNVTIEGLSISDPAAGYGININSGADNITIKDNVIHDIGTTLPTGSAQAISIQPGTTGTFNGYTIIGNTITKVGNLTLVQGLNSGSSAKGIYIGDSTGTGIITGVDIENNIISNIKASTNPWHTTSPYTNATEGRGAYGILVGYGQGSTHTGHLDNLVFKNNTISDLEGLWSHAVGLEGNTPDASITYNDISNLVDHKGNTDAAGVRIEDNTFSNIVINHNNLADNVMPGISNGTATAVNGQSNWWGDQNPSDQVSGSVNTFGFLGGPVTGLINGTDQNGNGYADLQDLALSPIVNAPIGLNSNEQKQLIMGVQVDGPSTDNTFQGASLNTDLTITIAQ
ncbi:MAG: SipW-dependent-type signal peptide-containing protein [Patescibacteria group bacterium]|nr:SipW-dependent-type signal peptide-containing protein [Patescibacteria group bacterium]